MMKHRKMKKKVKLLAIAAVAAIAVVIVLLSNVTTMAMLPESIATKAVFSTEALAEVPDQKVAVEGYRNQLTERMAEETFWTAEERKLLEENGYTIVREGCISEYSTFLEKEVEYEYPIIFNTEEGVELWYLDAAGAVSKKPLSNIGEAGVTVGNVHCENGKLIRENQKYAIAYDSESGKVSVMEFGELKAEYEVPQGAKYTGFSYEEGYIFRKGGEVYAIQTFLEDENTKGVLKIAENVRQVVIPDYQADTLEWSQPLLLMKDGSLKYYSDGELYPVKQEGGYRG